MSKYNALIGLGNISNSIAQLTNPTIVQLQPVTLPPKIDEPGGPITIVPKDDPLPLYENIEIILKNLNESYHKKNKFFYDKSNNLNSISETEIQDWFSLHYENVNREKVIQEKSIEHNSNDSKNLNLNSENKKNNKTKATILNKPKNTYDVLKDSNIEAFITLSKKIIIYWYWKRNKIKSCLWIYYYWIFTINSLFRTSLRRNNLSTKKIWGSYNSSMIFRGFFSS